MRKCFIRARIPGFHPTPDAMYGVLVEWHGRKYLYEYGAGGRVWLSSREMAIMKAEILLFGVWLPVGSVFKVLNEGRSEPDLR